MKPITTTSKLLIFGCLVGVAVTTALGSSTLVQAHKGAKGIVMERMMAMKSISESMKTIGLMVRGKTQVEDAKLKDAAAAINKHATTIPKMFPKGSINGPSEALPAIWEKWQDFESQAKDLASYASKIETLSDANKDTLKPLFAGLAKTCSGCHQDFRKKKE